MEKQNSLIIIALFAIAILLTQSFIIQPASAITIETATFGATKAVNEFTGCQYISTTNVWCATSTGIKVWNPTSRTVVATLKSSGNFDDIKCTTSVCYGWEVSGVTGNLTRWIVSTRTLDDFQPFVGNTGFVTGHGIGLVAGGDENTLLLPVEGQTCVDGVTPLGGTNEKGICLWSGGSGVLFNGDRFITSSQTADTYIIYDVEWNEGSGLFGNRAMVKFRDSVGVFQWQLLNLGDGDSTFATNRICQTASLTGTTTQSKYTIIDGILFDTYSTSDLLVLDTTLDTCATSAKNNYIDESTTVAITYDSTDDLFLVSSLTAGAGGGDPELGALYVFNSTLSGINTVAERILKVNLTSTDNNYINFHFNHASEGEIQVWRGSDMLIIGELLTATGEESPSTGGINCELPENENILICRLGGDGTLGSAGAFVIGNTTQGTGILGIGCSIGLVDCTEDSNPQTNGLGILIFIASIFVVVGMFYKSLGASATFQLPVFIWILIIVALSAFFTLTGIIDPVFLILSIICVIALAVPKVVGIIGNRGFGGGGSTE